MANSQHPQMLPVPPLPPPPPQPNTRNITNTENDIDSEKAKDGIPYIGSRISLISKTDIRYEGYLFNIDTRQSMVALQNVRSFGTEGRRRDHVPLSDTILPFATFKASEIKDLHVCEAAPAAFYHIPPVVSESRDTAVHHQLDTDAQFSMPYVNGSKSPVQQPTEMVYERRTEQTIVVEPLHDPSSLRQADVSTEERINVHEQVSRYRPSNASSTKGSRTAPGMGGHLLKRKERKFPGDDKSSAVSTSNDFNIEQALTGFDKEKEFEKLTGDEQKGSYQKSSFFDTISCDALDRLEGHTGRVSLNEERRLNTETFGAVGLNTGRRNYRGGRGRGGRGYRGGHGRGWGGGNRSGRTAYRRTHTQNEKST